jgi:hypothetical protein
MHLRQIRVEIIHENYEVHYIEELHSIKEEVIFLRDEFSKFYREHTNNVLRECLER